MPPNRCRWYKSQTHLNTSNAMPSTQYPQTFNLQPRAWQHETQRKTMPFVEETCTNQSPHSKPQTGPNPKPHSNPKPQTSKSLTPNRRPSQMILATATLGKKHQTTKCAAHMTTLTLWSQTNWWQHWIHTCKHTNRWNQHEAHKHRHKTWTHSENV